MRRSVLRTLTLLWLFGILFPMAFLAQRWPAFGALFDRLFAPAWMHVLMHGLLYAVLAFLLAVWITPLTPKKTVLLLGVCLLVGLFHEALQLLTRRFWPGWQAELFDLAIDLAGALPGLAAWKFLARRRSRNAPPVL